MISRSVARGDRFFGFGVIVVSALVAFVLIPGGIVLPNTTEARSLSPDFWPLIITGLAALNGLAMLVVGERAAGDDGSPPESRAAIWTGGRRAALVLALAMVFYLAVPIAGIFTPSVAITLVMMHLAGERRWVLMLLIAIILPALLWFFFTSIAQVPLPAGPLGGII